MGVRHEFRHRKRSVHSSIHDVAVHSASGLVGSSPSGRFGLRVGLGSLRPSLQSVQAPPVITGQDVVVKSGRDDGLPDVAVDVGEPAGPACSALGSVSLARVPVVDEIVVGDAPWSGVLPPDPLRHRCGSRVGPPHAGKGFRPGGKQSCAPEP